MITRKQPQRACAQLLTPPTNQRGTCSVLLKPEDRMDRHRMDRSLDEIAAEMNSSGLNRGASSVPFGQDYEERDFIGAPIRGVSNSSGSSRRHAPYSTSRSSFRDREGSLDKEDSVSNRVFVANLSYNTTWQMLKDYMRKGLHTCLLILSLWWECSV